MQAAAVCRGMLRFSTPALWQMHAVAGNAGGLSFPLAVDCAYLFGLTAVLLGIVWAAPNSAARLQRFTPSGKTLTAAAALFSAAVLCLSRESIFIYFNF